MLTIDSEIARTQDVRPRVGRNESVYAIAVSGRSAHGDTEQTWQAMLNGDPLVIKMMDNRDHSLMSNRFTDFHCPLPTNPLLEFKDHHESRWYSRNAALNILHSRDLLNQAGLSGDDGLHVNSELIDSSLMAVIIASGYGPNGAAIKIQDIIERRGPAKVSATEAGKEFPEQPVAQAIAAISGPEGFGGFSLSLAAACASGSQAIAMAIDQIKLGGYELAIAGGVETVGDEYEDLVMGSFSAFRALSDEKEDRSRASRPFDAKRTGFVAGSGIGLVLLASASFVDRTGVTPLAQINRRAVWNDGSTEMTRAIPDIQARELTRMLYDLSSNGVIVPDILWAHGTSTGLGDRNEIAVAKKVFGDLIRSYIDIYAPKSVLCHTLGASGGHAVLTAIMAIRDRKVPFMPTLDNPQTYSDQELANPNFRPDPKIPEDLFEGVNFRRGCVKPLNPNQPLSILVGNQGFGSNNAYVLVESV